MRKFERVYARELWGMVCVFRELERVRARNPLGLRYETLRGGGGEH